jgi:hypothetical protein
MEQSTKDTICLKLFRKFFLKRARPDLSDLWRYQNSHVGYVHSFRSQIIHKFFRYHKPEEEGSMR